MADELVTLSDGTIVDPESGEIIEEGYQLAAASMEEGGRAKWLAAQYDLASRQSKAWNERRVAVSIVLDKVATTKKFETDDIRVTMVASTFIDTAKAEDIMRAERMEIITIEEATDLILRSAKGNVDVGVVKEWIAGQPEERRKVLTEALIGGYNRAGYPLIKPVLLDAGKAAARG